MASKSARLKRRQENRKRRAKNEARAAAAAAAQGRADELKELNAAHDAGKAAGTAATGAGVTGAATGTDTTAGDKGNGPKRTEPGKADERAAKTARKTREFDDAAKRAAKRLAEQQRVIDSLPGHEKDRKAHRTAGKPGSKPEDGRTRRERLRRNVTRVIAAVVGVSTLIGVAAAGIIGSF